MGKPAVVGKVFVADKAEVGFAKVDCYAQYGDWAVTQPINAIGYYMVTHLPTGGAGAQETRVKRARAIAKALHEGLPKFDLQGLPDIAATAGDIIAYVRRTT